MNTLSNITACRGFIQKRNLVLRSRNEHRFTLRQQGAEGRARSPRDGRAEHKITGQDQQHNSCYIKIPRNKNYDHTSEIRSTRREKR
jgi:hypothetical protein